MATAPTPIAAGPTVPDRTVAEPTFDAQYEAFNAWEKNELQPGANALAANVFDNATDAATSATSAATQAGNAATSAAGAVSSATAAAASAGAALWVSGTTYSIGDVRYSPATQRVYRRLTAGAGTTDPSADGTNWKAVDSMPVVVAVAGTTQTAVAFTHYILTGAACAVTLPATVAAGDTVWITWTNTLATNTVLRNGQTIMGLAEDMTLDALINGTVQLRFLNSSWRIL